MSLLQWFHDSFSPLVNVDGTPMVNSFIDILGNPYGMTENDHQSAIDPLESHDPWKTDTWNSSGTDTL